MRSSYCGQPVNESARFDAEFIGAGTVWAVWAVAHTDF